MKKAKDIHRLLENVDLSINADADKEVLETVLRAGRKSTASVSQGNIWRIIMKSRATKCAVAAAVIIAATLCINQFGGFIGGTSVAWAKVAERIDLLPVFVHREKRVAMSDGKEIPFLKSDVVAYYSPEHGMREDMYNEDGLLLHQVYSLWLEKKTITIQPALKQYKVVGLDNAKLEQFRTNLKHLVQPIESGEYTELGRKELDGVEVEGIEISDPDIMAGSGYPIEFDSLVIRLWADVETSLLYRIEAEATSSDKYVTQFTDGKPVEIGVVTKEFQWDVELNKSIFEPKIQDDYTLMPE